MLVLTRKKGQKLIINDDIEVTILEVRGDSIKVGIKAPKSVSIFREEVYEEIKKANKQSLSGELLDDLTKLTMGTVKKDFAADYLNKLKNVSNKLSVEKTEK